jgi:hypothetical protein
MLPSLMLQHLRIKYSTLDVQYALPDEEGKSIAVFLLSWGVFFSFCNPKFIT